MNPVRTPQVAAVSEVNVAVECLGHFAPPSPGQLRAVNNGTVSYLALARKYRPRRFGEVKTQEHVSETLRHAVAGDRVGHAYLFCGPRGVGKTTLARILAMALNCPDRTEEGEPCGTCADCDHIWAGHTSLDVVEIDAASNRGVDDARELRERAMYAPSEEARFKVYILDEAHMLTREAWNALLKILEEPPPRVIFVFATTEARKIQQTASPILSRCQRFDFRRIGANDIMNRLGEVLDAEGIAADPEALRAIARKANGGMRDGLSLLDQVLALSDVEVSVESVVRVLGVVAEQRYLELFDLIIERRHGAVFDFVETLIDEGHDLVEFYHGLAEKLRLLLRIALDSGAAADGLSDELRQEFGKRAAAFSPGDLVRMLAMSSGLEADGSLRRTGRPRVLVEMLLLRMSYLDRTIELEEIIRALGGSPARDPAPAVVGASPSPPTPAAGPVSPPRSSARSVPTRGSGASPGGRGPSMAPVPSRSLSEAWKLLLADKKKRIEGVPTLLMHAASVVKETADGVLVLSVPDGMGAERMREPSARRRLEEALALHSGRDSAKISIVGEDGDPGQGRRSSERRGSRGDGAARVTEETVRETRLQELVKRAPQIERAVMELDLELVD